MVDAARKGNWKLSTRNVREIRELYATGKWTQRALTDKFGVGRETVRKILAGLSWTWLE